MSRGYITIYDIDPKRSRAYTRAMSDNDNTLELVTRIAELTGRPGAKDQAWRLSVAEAVQEEALAGIGAVLSNLYREACNGSYKASIAFLDMFLKPILEARAAAEANPIEAVQSGSLVESLDRLAAKLLDDRSSDQEGAGQDSQRALSQGVEAIRVEMFRSGSPLLPGGVLGRRPGEETNKTNKTNTDDIEQPGDRAAEQPGDRAKK